MLRASILPLCGRVSAG